MGSNSCLFSCNRCITTPTTVQRLHILILATVMTVHPYILQQILAYRYYYIHTIIISIKYKKPRRCGCGCFLGGVSAVAVLLLCWCAVFVRFWAVLGVFWCLVGKLSTRCPFVRSACVFRLRVVLV